MHDKRFDESSRQLIDIVAKYSHPSYDNPDRSHDVGTNIMCLQFSNICMKISGFAVLIKYITELAPRPIIVIFIGHFCPCIFTSFSTLCSIILSGKQEQQFLTYNCSQDFEIKALNNSKRILFESKYFGL